MNIQEQLRMRTFADQEMIGELDARNRLLQQEENRLVQENINWQKWQTDFVSREHLEPRLPPERHGDEDHLGVVKRLGDELQEMHRAFFVEQSHFSDQLSSRNKTIDALEAEQRAPQTIADSTATATPDSSAVQGIPNEEGLPTEEGNPNESNDETDGSEPTPDSNDE